MILSKAYSTAPDGICGNEDCGQMSAWYVLASLGLYPVCPGSGEYVLTAPLFSESVIRLANGKTLTIKADNPKRPYIAGVELNGTPVDRNWLTYDEIMGGGELSFKLREARARTGRPARALFPHDGTLRLPAGHPGRPGPFRERCGGGALLPDGGGGHPLHA